METATPIISLTAAELVSLRANFTTYIRSYLIAKGINEAFVNENIDAEVLLDGFADPEITTLQPAEAQPRDFRDRQFDKATTGHLQRYLRDEGIPPHMCKQATGPHIVDSVLAAMPDELLREYRDNQAARVADSPVGKEKTDRRDSLTTTTPPLKRARDDDSDYEDFPTKHRRTNRNVYAKKSPRNRAITKPVKAEPAPETKLDLSQSDHIITTPELSKLELSEDSTFNANITTQEYYDFLHGSATFHATRFAAVCVTLSRAKETQKAIEFGQFGLDLLGPALFNAHVVLCEGCEEVEDSMLHSRVALIDCIDDIHNSWLPPLATRLRNLVIEHDMWWSKAMQ